MLCHSLVVVATSLLAASAHTVLKSREGSGIALKRQQDQDSTCIVYGIDFQNDASYFINNESNEDFTLVTQFEGCRCYRRADNCWLAADSLTGNNDTASILLVNDDTSDEYECTPVPTVPQDTSQLSVCPIKKNQIATGSYSILTIGNNGNGNPFCI
jgi:hypothetical protein